MSSHKPLLSYALLAAALSLTQLAAAQNQAATPSVKQDSDKTKRQEVEVKAKSEVENQRRDAAAKSIVSNADLIRYGDTNITEAMKRVPGVIVVKGVMQLPGMNSGYTQILVDGEPPRGISINDIPIQSIERVEIYRLGSAEFSSQGVAGTINIILKKVPQTKQNNLTLTLSHETKSTPQISWTSSDKWDNLSYSITASANKHAMPSISSIHTYEHNNKGELVREYTHSRSSEFPVRYFRINPVIQYKKPDGFNLKITTNLQTSDAKHTETQRYEISKGTPFPFPHIIQHNQFRDASAGTTIKLLDKLGESTKLDLSVSASGRRSNFQDKELNFNANERMSFERFSKGLDQESRVSTSLKLTAPSNVEHDIVGGVNFSNVNNRNERNQELTIVNTQPELIADTINRQTTHSVINTYAAFIQDEWKFRKDSSAYFGLRWESVRVISENDGISNTPNASSVWSPIVQTLWQLNPDNTDRLRFGISRTFKAPFGFAITAPKVHFQDNSQSRPNFRGNSDLKPELAWSLEASYEHNDAQELAYSFKMIVRKISGQHRMQTRIIDNFWWRQIVNAGEGISKRIDFNTQFPLKRFWNDSPNINLSFDASKNWSSVSYLPEPHNKLTNIPFSAGLNLDFTAKNFPLSMGGSLRYRQTQPILLALNQRSSSPSSVDLDLYALWKFAPKTKLRFAIDNVLNRQNDQLMQWFNPENEISQLFKSQTYRQLRLTFDHGF